MPGSHTWAGMHAIVPYYQLIKPAGALMLSATLRTKAILFAFIRKTAALEMHTSCNCFNDSGRVSNELKRKKLRGGLWKTVLAPADFIYGDLPMLADAKCFFILVWPFLVLSYASAPACAACDPHWSVVCYSSGLLSIVFRLLLSLLHLL